MKYRTIVADPPWAYPEGFSWFGASGFDSHVVPGKRYDAVLPYAELSVADIAALPVRSLADSSGCRLFLWVTNKYLRAGFDVMDGWGFRYGQTLVWHKLGCSPIPRSVAPNSAEFLLVGSLGSPGRQSAFPSAVLAHGVPKAHSRKPDLFTDWIEQVSPGPYVELFSRRHRLGWDVHGFESANTAQLETA